MLHYTGKYFFQVSNTVPSCRICRTRQPARNQEYIQSLKICQIQFHTFGCYAQWRWIGDDMIEYKTCYDKHHLTTVFPDSNFAFTLHSRLPLLYLNFNVGRLLPNVCLTATLI